MWTDWNKGDRLKVQREAMFAVTVEQETPEYGNIELLPAGSELVYEGTRKAYDPHTEEHYLTLLFYYEGIEVSFWAYTQEFLCSLEDKLEVSYD